MAVRAEDERLSVREAAKACGKNAETIRRWIWSGKLPAEKLGNQLFVKQSDLKVLPGKDEDYARVEDWMRRARALRDKIRKRTGTEFDGTELVRESREEYLRNE